MFREDATAKLGVHNADSEARGDAEPADGPSHASNEFPAISPRLSPQKQAGHVKGSPQYDNRIKQGKPTSAFDDMQSAEQLTLEAWQRGTPVPGRTNVRDYDFGHPVGIGPNGGVQTKVRVHKDRPGRIHGHPVGPEY